MRPVAAGSRSYVMVETMIKAGMDVLRTTELTELVPDFIQKPILPKDLLKKVREILDR